MKRLLIFCCFFTTCLNASSQKVVDVEKSQMGLGAADYLNLVTGTPYVDAKFVRLASGSPFFNEKMMKGVIVTTDRIEYRNITIRLNLMESQVNFLHNKQEMVVSVPLREVTLWDSLNNKNHRFIFSDYIETTGKPERGFYEVVEQGKAELYAQHKKTMRETRQFNAATYEQLIETNSTNFVVIGGQWKKVNKIKDLPSILTDKKSEVQEYISSKGLSGYKQEDVASVITYYNSLFEKKE